MAPDPISVLEQWYRYEEIAMHFNNLIMQFRLQLLGGAGLIGTIASYLIGGKVKPDLQRHWITCVVSAGLFVLLAATASLDVFYYNRLLTGAVRALLEFEAKHPEIQMSTRIEDIVGPGKYTIWWSYAMVLAALGAFGVWSFVRYRRGSARLRSRQAAKARRSAGV